VTLVQLGGRGRPVETEGIGIDALGRQDLPLLAPIGAEDSRVLAPGSSPFASESSATVSPSPPGRWSPDARIPTPLNFAD